MAGTNVRETFRPHSSSHIDEATYDPEAQELQVTFKDGNTYLYSNVPPETYSGLTRATSVGSYFHRHIRGTYAYESL